jgi:predicted RNA-binding Zn-ribbon protein involved in translation (DUF1610 family)
MTDKKSMKLDILNNDVVQADTACAMPVEQVNEDGSFKCPKCNAIISPDDETEDAYKILETKMVEDEIAEIIIECRACGTIITLAGSQLQ